MAGHARGWPAPLEISQESCGWWWLALATGIAVCSCGGASPSGRSAPAPPTETQLDPSAFASGACVAFEPTKGDRHETVFLDAGHGGIDPGGVGTTQAGKTIYEADETLPVELDAMALLRAKGFRVVVSRTKDTTVVRLSAADESGRGPHPSGLS